MAAVEKSLVVLVTDGYLSNHYHKINEWQMFSNLPITKHCIRVHIDDLKGHLAKQTSTLPLCYVHSKNGKDSEKNKRLLSELDNHLIISIPLGKLRQCKTLLECEALFAHSLIEAAITSTEKNRKNVIETMHHAILTDGSLTPTAFMKQSDILADFLRTLSSSSKRKRVGSYESLILDSFASPTQPNLSRSQSALLIPPTQQVTIMDLQPIDAIKMRLTLRTCEVFGTLEELASDFAKNKFSSAIKRLFDDGQEQHSILLTDKIISAAQKFALTAKHCFSNDDYQNDTSLKEFEDILVTETQKIFIKKEKLHSDIAPFIIYGGECGIMAIKALTDGLNISPQFFAEKIVEAYINYAKHFLHSLVMPNNITPKESIFSSPKKALSMLFPSASNSKQTDELWMQRFSAYINGISFVEEKNERCHC